MTKMESTLQSQMSGKLDLGNVATSPQRNRVSSPGAPSGTLEPQSPCDQVILYVTTVPAVKHSGIGKPEF